MKTRKKQQRRSAPRRVVCNAGEEKRTEVRRIAALHPTCCPIGQRVDPYSAETVLRGQKAGDRARRRHKLAGGRTGREKTMRDRFHGLPTGVRVGGMGEGREGEYGRVVGTITRPEGGVVMEGEGRGGGLVDGEEKERKEIGGCGVGRWENEGEGLDEEGGHLRRERGQAGGGGKGKGKRAGGGAGKGTVGVGRGRGGGGWGGDGREGGRGGEAGRDGDREGGEERGGKKKGGVGETRDREGSRGGDRSASVGRWNTGSVLRGDPARIVFWAKQEGGRAILKPRPRDLYFRCPRPPYYKACIISCVQKIC